MVRLTLVVVAIVAFTGCKTENPDYCSNNPSQQGCPDARTTGGSCQMDHDCTLPNLKVCDTGSNGGTCVQCTEGENTCASSTPACVADKCQKCTQHSQCPSHACKPDGTCADSAQVAYVRPSGGGTACTDTLPCKTLSDGINTARPIVKIEGAISASDVTTIDGKMVQILADPGSTFTCTKAGTTLDIKNDNADVDIYDLEITGGSGTPTDATVSLSGGSTPKLLMTRVKIDNNAGIGVLASSGSLTMSQSTIIGNAGGGISITRGAFDLINNFIVANGGVATPFGGVLIKQSDNGTRRFEFNTVASNVANTTSGVLCTSVMNDFTLSNNIIFDNVLIGAGSQVEGMHCNWTFSDIGKTGDSTSVSGMGNINTVPMFIDPLNNDLQKKNFHLKSGSPAIDSGNTDTAVSIDFDGDLRPQGSNSDVGADEFVSTP